MTPGDSFYELRLARDLHSPVLVVTLDGWIDAGFSGSAAMAHLLGSLRTEVMAVFDADELIDHRARRPILRIENGLNAGLTWPELQLRVGRDASGNDVLLLTGPEPDFRWHAFVRTVVGLTADMGVRMMVALGGFPAPVPHTRPVRVVSVASSAELAATVGYMPGVIEVSAGVSGALEQGFSSAGIPAVGLWARVPHYVAAMPYPAASAALVDGLASLTGLELDTSELHAAATVTTARIGEMIANSGEHTQMVRQLEEAVDATEGEPRMEIADLPSGDELAAELERFLREQRGDQ